MNEVKRYMNAIERNLCLDRRTRARVMADLASDFQNRRDAGQSDAEIMAELGAPAQAAAEFNAAFAAEGQGAVPRAWGAPSRWRWLFLAAAVLALLANLAALWVWRYMPVYEGRPDGSLGIIGGADGPTAVFVAGAGSMGMLAGPWLALTALAALCGFLLLGWCRADRRRLWLPMLLCGAPLAVLAVRFAAALYLLSKTGEMQFAVTVLSPTALAALPLAAVLVWAVWLYRRSGRR